MNIYWPGAPRLMFTWCRAEPVCTTARAVPCALRVPCCAQVNNLKSQLSVKEDELRPAVHAAPCALLCCAVTCCAQVNDLESQLSVKDDELRVVQERLDERRAKVHRLKEQIRDAQAA